MQIKLILLSILILLSGKINAQVKPDTGTTEEMYMARGKNYVYDLKNKDKTLGVGMRDKNKREILPPLFSSILMINENYAITTINSLYMNIYKVDSGFLLPQSSFKD